MIEGSEWRTKGIPVHGALVLRPHYVGFNCLERGLLLLSWFWSMLQVGDVSGEQKVVVSQGGVIILSMPNFS